MTQNNEPPEIRWKPIVIPWSIGTLMSTILGGYVSVKLGYPAFLGGGVCLVFVGMVGLFVLASKLSGRH